MMLCEISHANRYKAVCSTYAAMDPVWSLDWATGRDGVDTPTNGGTSYMKKIQRSPASPLLLFQHTLTWKPPPLERVGASSMARKGFLSQRYRLVSESGQGWMIREQEIGDQTGRGGGLTPTHRFWDEPGAPILPEPRRTSVAVAAPTPPHLGNISLHIFSAYFQYYVHSRPLGLLKPWPLVSIVAEKAEKAL
jgi:hypothetical protein